MNYKYHLYCGRCCIIYRREEFKRYKNPKCPACGKMLRKGPRKKRDVKRISIELDDL